jgi:hypothetical protein
MEMYPKCRNERIMASPIAAERYHSLDRRPMLVLVGSLAGKAADTARGSHAPKRRPARRVRKSPLVPATFLEWRHDRALRINIHGILTG